MLVFKDLFTEDELCSDTYAIELLDGVMFKVKAKYTTETTDIDESKLGANKSEEAPDEGGADPSAVSGINVCLANRLVETGFTKKGYQTHIREYIKKIVGKLTESGKSDEEVADIKAGLAKQVKVILGEFKDYQFFMGESADDEGMMIPVKYGEDGETPYVYLFKHGLIEEKV